MQEIFVVVVLYILSVYFCFRCLRDTKSPKISRRFLLFPIFLPFIGSILFVLVYRSTLSEQKGYRNLPSNEVLDLYLGKVEKTKFYFPSKAQVDRSHSLETVLYLHHTKDTRDLLMGLAGKEPLRFLDLLRKARLDSDVEVVHYATTYLSEISSQFEKKLTHLEVVLQKEPMNEKYLKEYCDLVEDYLNTDLLSSGMERLLRREYQIHLEAKLRVSNSEEDRVRLIRNFLALKNYDPVEEQLLQLRGRWPLEEIYLLQLEFYFETGQQQAFQESLEEIRIKKIQFSDSNRIRLECFQEQF